MFSALCIVHVFYTNLQLKRRACHRLHTVEASPELLKQCSLDSNGKTKHFWSEAPTDFPRIKSDHLGFVFESCSRDIVLSHPGSLTTSPKGSRTSFVSLLLSLQLRVEEGCDQCCNPLIRRTLPVSRPYKHIVNGVCVCAVKKGGCER